jgi:hypothetical protein
VDEDNPSDEDLVGRRVRDVHKEQRDAVGEGAGSGVKLADDSVCGRPPLLGGGPGYCMKVLSRPHFADCRLWLICTGMSFLAGGGFVGTNIRDRGFVPGWESHLVAVPIGALFIGFVFYATILRDRERPKRRPDQADDYDDGA